MEQQRRRMDEAAALVERVNLLRERVLAAQAELDRPITDETEAADRSARSVLENRWRRIVNEFYGEDEAFGRANFPYFPDRSQRENLADMLPRMLAEIDVILDDLDAWGSGTWTPQQVYGNDWQPATVPERKLNYARLAVLVAGSLVLFIGSLLGALWVLNRPALKPHLVAEAFPGTTWSTVVGLGVSLVFTVVVALPVWRWAWSWVVGAQPEPQITL